MRDHQNSGVRLRKDIDWCREVERERWEAHHELHKTADIVRAKTDEELNDVRLRFIARDVYEAQRQADQRLMLALLVLLVMGWGASLGAVVALVR